MVVCRFRKLDVVCTGAKKEARRLIAAARCGFGTMMECCTINKTSWAVIVETGASQIELIVANLQVAEI